VFQRKLHDSDAHPANEEKAEDIEKAQETHESEAPKEHQDDRPTSRLCSCCGCIRIDVGESIQVVDLPSLDERVRGAEEVLAELCAHTRARLSGSFS